MDRLTLQRNRAIGFLFVVVALTPLLISGRLRPNAQGLGSHQQLGLPPCSIRVLWGIRCPACGMTTSWAWFMRGRWVESAHANVGGLLLALSALAVIATGAIMIYSNRLPGPRVIDWAAWLSVTIAVVTLIQWGWRLWLSPNA